MSQKDQKIKSFVLCADDFGISPSVSKAIMTLFEKDKISATSCMVHGSGWIDYATPLRSFSSTRDIGLHLTLTDQKTPSSLPTLAPSGYLPSFLKLSRGAFTKTLPLNDVRDTVHTQLSLFMDTFGSAPDFIDGHHHVHQLPGIRDIVMEELLQFTPSNRPYVRTTCEKWATIIHRGVAPLKAAALDILGTSLKSAAVQAGLRSNDGFTGIYALNSKEPYSHLFAHFVSDLAPRSIVMCHPGIVDQTLMNCDVLTDRREEEFQYFLSDEFERCLNEEALCIGRLG